MGAMVGIMGISLAGSIAAATWQSVCHCSRQRSICCSICAFSFCMAPHSSLSRRMRAFSRCRDSSCCVMATMLECSWLYMISAVCRSVNANDDREAGGPTPPPMASGCAVPPAVPEEAAAAEEGRKEEWGERGGREGKEGRSGGEEGGSGGEDGGDVGVGLVIKVS